MNKTFRLFISSTFNDFRKEREILQTKVFPIVKEYAASLDYTFQPIDLRWGVSNEAQLDQKTLELCLNEVRACKTTLHPNFLVMLGDRYGWVPLPYAIEEVEFTSLLTLMSQKEKESIQAWYYLDKNQIPSSYILKERADAYKDYNTWVQVENNLRSILQKTVNNSNIALQQKEKYFQSATEAEVEEGILQFKKTTKFQQNVLNEENDTEHIFGFFRNIDKSTKQKNLFIEDDYEQAQTFKKEVKKELQQENILSVQTSQIDKVTLNETYLIEFEKRIIHFLTSQIDIQKEREKKENLSPLKIEIQAQSHFAIYKRKNFIAQKELRTTIADYITNDKREVLVLYGASGRGKSALMSKAIQEAENTLQSKIVYRFIGATPFSSSTKEILSSICNELDIDISSSNKEESFEDFSYRVHDEFKKITDNVSIFIDAIDQLQNDDQFLWLPRQLPANVKIIISALDDENYKEDSNYFKTLQNITTNSYEISPFNEPLELLKSILQEDDRTVDKYQEKYFLTQYKNVNSPLYVTIAAQEMKNWKSGDTTQNLQNTQRGIIREFISNLVEFYHHNEEFLNRVLGFIYASKDGLSESELLQLLAQDEKFIKRMAPETWHENLNKELPLVHWTRLHTQLKPFFSSKTQDNEELIYFFHREFEDVVKKSTQQQDEHELIIIATQSLILKNKDKEFNSNRWGKLYTTLIIEYEIKYGNKHKEYNCSFIIDVENIRWQEEFIMNTLNLHDLSIIQNKLYFTRLYAEYNYLVNKKLLNLLPEHWVQSYMMVSSTLLSIYSKTNMSSHAIDFIEENFSELEQIYFDNEDTFHGEFSTLLKVMAQCYFIDHAYEKSTDFMDKAFSIYLKSDYTKEGLLAYHNDLATSYHKTDHIDEATFHFEKSFEILQDLNYTQDTGLQEMYIGVVSNLTQFYLKNGLTQDNLNLLQSAQVNIEKLYVNNTNQWVSLYVVFMNNLSGIYKNIGDTQKEFDTSKNILIITQKEYEKEPDVWAEIYFSILYEFGGIYVRAKIWDEAVKYFTTAAEIASDAYKKNPNMWVQSSILCLTDLARTYSEQYEVQKQIKTLTKLYIINVQTYGENSEEANKIVQEITNLQ